MFQPSVAVLDGRLPFGVQEVEQRCAAQNGDGSDDEESRLVVKCSEDGNAINELEGEHLPDEMDGVVETVSAEEDPCGDDYQQGVEDSQWFERLF